MRNTVLIKKKYRLWSLILSLVAFIGPRVKCHNLYPCSITALTVTGFDLAWFSSLSSEYVSIFGLHGAIYI